MFFIYHLRISIWIWIIHMTENPISCSFNIEITVFEGFDAFLLFKSHTNKHSNWISWYFWTSTSISCRRLLLYSQRLIYACIIHVFKIPSNSHISIVISCLIKSMFSWILRNAHLQNHIQQTLIKLWFSLNITTRCFREGFFTNYWLSIICGFVCFKIDSLSIWNCQFNFKFFWNPIIKNEPL